MNMITNDRGETVAAEGNEISIARAKVRWPSLIEATQKLYKQHPHYVEEMLINQIAAKDIRNTYEAQAILDAAILPITATHTIDKDKRIMIDPELYTAMFKPTRFNVGDEVTFVNDYGVVFEDRTITGVEKCYGRENRYYMTPNDAPWFASKECNFHKMSKEEQSEYKAFTITMHNNYFGKVDPNNINKLCQIAHDLQKDIEANSKGIISDKDFNDITAIKEFRIKTILKDFPGTKAEIDYERTIGFDALRLHLPGGQQSGMQGSGYAVPAIPIIARQTQQPQVIPAERTQAKGRKR